MCIVPRAIAPGVGYALLTALSFGGLTTLARLYYQDGGNALTMLLFRFAVTALALGLLRGACVVLAAAVVLGERLTALQWGGAVCVLGALMWSQRVMARG